MYKLKKVVVKPIQTIVGPSIVAFGAALTSMGSVGNDVHPPVRVKENVAVPVATPVTKPLLETVAIKSLLLAQVPPVEGDN